MKEMLQKSQKSRLGGSLDYDAVQKHAFLSTMNWNAVKLRNFPSPDNSESLLRRRDSSTRGAGL